MLFQRLTPGALFFTAPAKKRWFGSTKTRAWSVKLLPVLFLDRYFSILSSAMQDPIPESTATARRDLRLLALETCPEDLGREFFRMSYAEMAQIVSALFFGEKTNEENKKAERETHARTELSGMSLEFFAARICHTFGAYTIRDAMNLSAGEFFALAELAERVQADEAINCIFPAVCASLNVENGLKALERLRGPVFEGGSEREGSSVRPPKKRYSKEAYEAAVARMHDPRLKPIVSFGKQGKITPGDPPTAPSL